MKKLRITKKDVCYMLSIKQDKLNKLIKTDENFPKAIKEGVHRQSAVYFDVMAIENWWNTKVNTNLIL